MRRSGCPVLPDDDDVGAITSRIVHETLPELRDRRSTIEIGSYRANSLNGGSNEWTPACRASLASRGWPRLALAPNCSSVPFVPDLVPT